MKLKVGMYVRTKKGNIGKITFISQLDGLINLDTENYSIGKHFIKGEPSFNLIDLIEVGDIITFKNSNDVYKVASIPNDTIDGFYLEYDLNYPETEDIYVDKEEMKNDLKSIVTKEQFSQISYNLGDE